MFASNHLIPPCAHKCKLQREKKFNNKKKTGPIKEAASWSGFQAGGLVGSLEARWVKCLSAVRQRDGPIPEGITLLDIHQASARAYESATCVPEMPDNGHFKNCKSLLGKQFIISSAVVHQLLE